MPRWVWRIVLTVVLLIGLPVLGISAGFALLRGWQNSDAENWRALGTPAENPAAIVDADLDVITVRGQDGSLFECDHTGPTRDNVCWKEVDQPREKDPDVENTNTYREEIPAPPGPVIETFDASWHFAERASYARYALLEDGSVWLWDYNADANWNLMLLMAGPICGLALAIVIVLAMWLFVGLRWLLRRRKAKKKI